MIGASDRMTVSSSTTSRRLSHRPGAAVPRADGVGPGRDRHHPRHRGGHHGRRPPRRLRDRHAHGNRLHPHAGHRLERRVHGALDPDRHLHGDRRDQRLQERVAVERPRRRRPARPRRHEARSRRHDRVGRDRGRRRRWSRPRSSDLSTTVDRGADQAAAAERPQLRQPDAHHPRRPARHPGLEHRRRRHRWPGAPRRPSRPTASVRATTTTCSTASTTTRRGCRRW